MFKISIARTGIGLAVPGVGSLLNNSIIQADTNERIPAALCLSGSAISGVGSLIAPDGTDITNTGGDAFDITVGGVDDPGSLNIKGSDSVGLQQSDQGVYTCSIPDHEEKTQWFHFGIFTSQFSG